MSSCFFALEAATRLEDHVTSFSTRARRSWYVRRSVPWREYLLMCAQQLDAGQHPAYDGLASLPFYDDFDLSTVDVLLISQ